MNDNEVSQSTDCLGRGTLHAGYYCRLLLLLWSRLDGQHKLPWQEINFVSQTHPLPKLPTNTLKLQGFFQEFNV